MLTSPTEIFQETLASITILATNGSPYGETEPKVEMALKHLCQWLRNEHSGEWDSLMRGFVDDHIAPLRDDAVSKATNDRLDPSVREAKIRESNVYDCAVEWGHQLAGSEQV